MALDLQKEISILRQHPEFGKYLGVALQRLQDSVNGLGTNLAADPTGTMPAPPPIQALNVKTDGNGTVHATINHSAAIQRGVHYFVEYSNDAAFSQPHVVHLGTSRTMNPITLPAMDDSGKPQKFFFRAYGQYPGGDPGEPVHFGGTVPTPVNPGGSVKLTLLQSTGSGTAQNSGQQAGSGFGRVLFRQPITTRRVTQA